MDLTDIQAALYAWVSTATGIDTRWAHQEAPREAYPFAVLDITSLQNQGQDTTELFFDEDDEEFDVSVLARRELILNVQVCTDSVRPANNARMYLEACNLSLRKPSVRDTLMAADIALINVSDALNLTQVIEGNYESRWSQDFRFNVTYEWTGLPGSTQETVDQIATVTADNGLEDPPVELTITG